ncbi:MAG: hypothetical protein FVQ82_09830 [Planctomycetes bacterium]|nr:hypothetical protein [Planctomycetota bacterium]
MKNAAILILLILLITISGCYTGPKYSFEIRKVTIETQPAGARVYQLNSAYRNETFLGTTPIREQPVSILTYVKGKLSSTVVDWMSSQIQMLNIRIEKSGYESYEGNLATDPEKTTTHSITLDHK